MRTGRLGGVEAAVMCSNAVGAGGAAEGALSAVCTEKGEVPAQAAASRRRAERTITRILVCHIGRLSTKVKSLWQVQRNRRSIIQSRMPLGSDRVASAPQTLDAG